MSLKKTKSELAKIKKASIIVAKTLKLLKAKIRPGITTKELDTEAEKFIRKSGAVPAFKGYRGYPASICASINEEVVHGIPGGRILRGGDIISVDIGVELDGFFGDAAITYPVGRISKQAEKLIDVTREALYKAINMAKKGNYLSDVSHAVQSHAEKAGFSVVRDFVGHGIGTSLHEEPQIPNFGEPGQGLKLEAGMVLAIEPMVNAGTSKVVVLDDGWTTITRDKKLSAHFEHTVCVTNEQAEIFTRVK
ncbi:MAG: type I methionyl aminopeptidase [Candidatus Omnitrophica bacterium]|nr:type I methionyl aminopeptidase [Candidatus Omnitrophota bacterium]